MGRSHQSMMEVLRSQTAAIELRDKTSIRWETAMTVRAEDLSATVTDVVEGQEYSFRSGLKPNWSWKTKCSYTFHQSC